MCYQREFNQVVEEYIRPLTFPVAVKLIREGDAFPKKTRFPVQTSGYRWALCQGIAMARRVGWTVGFKKEDLSCILALMMFGYEAEPEAVKNGEIVYPYYTETVEAGKITQEGTPRLPLDDVTGIVVAPLAKAEFNADVVLVYGNGAQIIRLVQGALYRQGGKIESAFTGRGACGSEIIVPYQAQECKVIIPGGGERVYAHTADDELVFAAPVCKLEDVAAGVVVTHKSGIARIPTPFLGMRAKPVYPENYNKLAEMFGIIDE